MSYGLRSIFALMVPATLVFLLLGREIVGVALQRRALQRPATRCSPPRAEPPTRLGLFSLGAFTFYQRFFYALQDFRSPLLVALGVSALDVACSLWLRGTPLQVAGLAVANTIAFTAGAAAMAVLVHRRLGRMDGRNMARTALKVCVSLVPLTGFLLLFKHLTRARWGSDSSLSALLFLAAALAGGILLLVLMYHFTRVEMARGLLPGVFRRISFRRER